MGVMMGLVGFSLAGGGGNELGGSTKRIVGNYPQSQNSSRTIRAGK